MWETSNRVNRLPNNWQAIKREVFRLKGKVCHLQYHNCTQQATQIDHIRPGDDHSIENLQPVCAACHTSKSTAEGVHARRRKAALRRRPPEPHPGDIR